MKKCLLYIGNKLSEHGMTVTSIETLGILLEKEGYQVFYASSKKNKTVRLFDMLFKTLKYRKQVDYVLIDTYSTYNFWYAFSVSQLCRVLKLKYIPKLHGGDLPKRLSKNPRLCSMIFKNAYKNIAPSGYLAEAFKDRNFAEILYIPNTIELKKYPFKVRTHICPKLLWVRSFTSIYNPEMALKVFHELKKKYPNAELCMVGPDKDGTLNKIQEMEKNLNLNVNFTGKLSKAQWVALSSAYDIFINTTHFDNTPVSVIEAIALGLPVVSTNVGGITYLLENQKTALLVDDNDVSGMVEAVQEILNNQTLTHSLVQNALIAIQNFDWEEVKGKWDEVLI
ncbi:MAG: glycosyltransferase family 4 protein [Burkholderiales bacterium]|nr:glycosyltransferase family 4 protein [Flavobacterium sp.]